MMVPASGAYTQMESQRSRAALPYNDHQPHVAIEELESKESESRCVSNDILQVRTMCFGNYFYAIHNFSVILVSLSISAMLILKIPVWHSCVFLRESKKRHSRLHQEKAGIVVP